MNFYMAWDTIKASKRHNPQNPITAAFLSLETGIKSAGHFITPYEQADTVIVFGSITRRKQNTDRAIAIKKYRESGKHLLSLDSGLFGTFIRKRINSAESNFWRIGYGDCTGQGDFLFHRMNRDRLTWLENSFDFKVQPENFDNRKPIMFIGQSEKGWQYDELVPYHEWASKEIQKIREHTNRKIIYRVHPTDVEHKRLANLVPDLEFSYGSRERTSIIEAIQNTGATTAVSHSSSALLEAMVMGLEVIAFSKRCPVYGGCKKSFWDEKFYNRSQKLMDYAHMSYHVSELQNPDLCNWIIHTIENKYA